MAKYTVKRYIVEEFQIDAENIKAARKIIVEDPVKVTVIKETVRVVKSDGGF